MLTPVPAIGCTKTNGVAFGRIRGCGMMASSIVSVLILLVCFQLELNAGVDGQLTNLNSRSKRNYFCYFYRNAGFSVTIVIMILIAMHMN